MKVPIKKYVEDTSLTWEERYKRLDAHHIEETSWMMNRIKFLKADLYLSKKERNHYMEESKSLNTFKDAIKTHREQTGHEMCWENDEELWTVLNDGVKIDHTPPSWCEFITKCAEYRKSKEK